MITEKIEGLADIERERVLNYFIDPKNGQMQYRDFAEKTASMFIGSNPTEEQLKMEQKMLGVFGEIQEARHFNATYLGHMLSESCIPAMWAQMLATRLGSNTVAREVSEMESRLEPEAMRGLMKTIGYDEKEASGTFTSGGSMAVFTAIDVAVKRVKRQFEASGKQIDKPLVFLYNPFAHYSFHKAIDALSGPNRMIEKVEVRTNGFKMDVADLQEKIEKYTSEGKIIAGIYAIAGETETGLVDPLTEIAACAEPYGIFKIADAAYGGPYRLSRKGNLFKSLNQFDATILDPHKTFYIPYSFSGAVLFRDKKDHVLLNLGVKASYVKFEDKEDALLRNLAYENPKFSLGEKRFEGSATAGSILATVAVLRTLGLEGLGTVYNITLDRIEHLNEILKKSKILVPVHEPDINLLCFRIRPELETKYGVNAKKRKEIVEATRIALDNGVTGESGYFFSSTDFSLPNHEGTAESTDVWRACLMNPRTTNETLDKAVAALEQLVLEKLESRAK